jgi:hypothetical protein
MAVPAVPAIEIRRTLTFLVAEAAIQKMSVAEAAGTRATEVAEYVGRPLVGDVMPAG